MIRALLWLSARGIWAHTIPSLKLVSTKDVTPPPSRLVTSSGPQVTLLRLLPKRSSEMLQRSSASARKAALSAITRGCLMMSTASTRSVPISLSTNTATSANLAGICRDAPPIVTSHASFPTTSLTAGSGDLRLRVAELFPIASAMMSSATTYSNGARDSRTRRRVSVQPMLAAPHARCPTSLTLQLILRSGRDSLPSFVANQHPTQ